MATLNVPYSFITATQIVASEMNSNFTAVKSFVEAIAAGTNIDSGAITSDKLATATIQLLTPTGAIMPYAGSSASVPTGWLLCDGTAVSQTTYAALYAVIGSTYNTSGGQAAPSAGTFRVPLLTGRVPVGRNAADADFDALGETGGAKNSVGYHQHGDGTLTAATRDINHFHAFSGTTSYVGNHQHVENQAVGDTYATYASNGFNNYTQTGSVAGYTEGAGAHDHTFGGNTGYMNTGALHDHDVNGLTSPEGTASGNLQPYIVVNYLIKI